MAPGRVTGICDALECGTSVGLARIELVMDFARLAIPTIGCWGGVGGLIILAMLWLGMLSVVVGTVLVADGVVDAGMFVDGEVSRVVPAVDGLDVIAAAAESAAHVVTIDVVIARVPDDLAALYTWLACSAAGFPCLHARVPSNSMLSCEFRSTEFISADSFRDVFTMYNKDVFRSRVGCRANALQAALLTKLAGLIFRLFFLILGGWGLMVLPVIFALRAALSRSFLFGGRA